MVATKNNNRCFCWTSNRFRRQNYCKLVTAYRCFLVTGLSKIWGRWSLLTDQRRMLKLNVKKMLHKLGVFTCDNDNRIWGAGNMWTHTWRGSIQRRRSVREGQPHLYRLKLFFLLLANNLLTLFSIYWLEDAALNQHVSQRATKCLIDFLTVITSFSWKSWLLDCKHFLAQRLCISASAWKNKTKKKQQPKTLICKDCRNPTSLVW